MIGSDGSAPPTLYTVATDIGTLNTRGAIAIPLFASRDSIWSSHAADDCILIGFWHVDSGTAKTRNRNLLAAERCNVMLPTLKYW